MHRRFALFGIIFAIVSNFTIRAQSATVSGSVISQNGEPLANAHIYLAENKWGISEEDGSFNIEKVNYGSYSLRISRVGYEPITMLITVPAVEDNLTITLEELVYGNKNPVVVTASRTSQELLDVSVPVVVIDDSEIENSGSLRLNEILDEQIGLHVVSDHGTGIQVQGFDPEYTLILIDNQPVIGRSAGTLDLTRLSVGNIQQIEIVKGPSSALWGSNALAGVINIITEKGNSPFNMDVTGRFGTHTTYDAGTNLSFKKDRLKGRFFANTNGSDGYDLNSRTTAPTTPEFQNYTFNGGVNYRLNRNVELGLSSRYYKEDQRSFDQITVDSEPARLNDEALQYDYSITPEIRLNFDQRFLVQADAFLSRYYSETNSEFSESGEVYFSDSFEQALNKYEMKGSAFWDERHTTVVGAGMNTEDLTAEIYAVVPQFNSYFNFAQHEMELLDDWKVTLGYRFDAHSKYKSQFSPKFSTLYKVNENIRFRASFGGGFKAPDFRQLFLSFTNPLAGYTVFGSTQVAEGIERLQADGQIRQLLVDPNELKEITAERSFAYNAGFDVFPVTGVRLALNVFRNNVDNLIETQRIALKTNGQSVFSYFNFDKVYTQGIETELYINPSSLKGFSVSTGVQYLDARRQITRTFDDVVDGQIVTKSTREFIPLYNRSKYSGNLKLNYFLADQDIDMSLRFTLRGRYWLYDYNENQRVDENEYALAANNLNELIDKTLINLSVAKTFAERYRLQVGVNNLTNFKNEVVLPSNPGTTFYAQLNIQLY
jgi:outer membrane receptor for ferrienterochelin and colicins